MKRKTKTNVSRKTITIKLEKTEQLYQLSRECGRIYSKTISFVRKIHKKKNFWLDESQMQKIIRSNKVHSQTAQAVIQKYFKALDSYFEIVETNPEARPPYKSKKYFCIPFKKTALNIEKNFIKLSCGKGNLPVIIPIPEDKQLENVSYAEIVWDNGYYFISSIGYHKMFNTSTVYALNLKHLTDITISVTID